MPRINNLIWEDREQAEYRAAKARFFRLLAILIIIIGILAVQIFML